MIDTETLKNDFYKLVEYTSVYAIKNKFNSNVDALDETGWPKSSDYKTLDAFNYAFAIPKKIVHSIFTVRVGGKVVILSVSDLIQQLVDNGKMTVFGHGRFFKNKMVCNRYVLSKTTLKQIFADEALLETILKMECYTPRQKKFISKTILTKMSEEQKQTYFNQEAVIKKQERLKKRRAKRAFDTKLRNSMALEIEELKLENEELKKELRELHDSPPKVEDLDEPIYVENEEDYNSLMRELRSMSKERLEREISGWKAAISELEDKNQDIDEKYCFDSEFLNKMERTIVELCKKDKLSYGESKSIVEKVCCREFKMPYRVGGYDQSVATSNQRFNYAKVLHSISEAISVGRFGVANYGNDPEYKTNGSTAAEKFKRAREFVCREISILEKIGEN